MSPIKSLLLLFLFLARPLVAQNRVLELDGQGSYVQLPGGIFDSLEEATVEAWVKWEDWAYFSQWFAFGADDQWRAMGVNHFEDSSILQFFIYTGRNDLHVLRLAADLPLGQWCHMAAVSGRGGMRFYLNGVLVGQNGFEGSFAAQGEGVDNYLGKSNWKDNAYFRGQLDEVRVWSVARSAEQISAGMRRPLHGGEDGLVGLWNFDAGDAMELSPQGQHGQLLGGARCVAAPFPGTDPITRPALVEGTVRDETGVPLMYAVVHLRKGDADLQSPMTRADGRYGLAVFDAGTYVLNAWLGNTHLQWSNPNERRRGDATSQTQEVLLQEGRALHLDLHPPLDKVISWPAEGNARDRTGVHNGELMGGTAFAPGLVGQAFNLDGVDDRVRVANAAGLTPSGSFSLVAWIFPTSDRQQKILGKWPHRPELLGHSEYLLGVDPGLVLTFDISDNTHREDGISTQLRSSANALTRNVWNQVAGVYDQDTGIRCLYVNGVEVARRQDLPIALTHLGTDLILGGVDSETPVWGFKGLIDEVAIYHRALTDVAVWRLYGASAEARWSGEGNADDTRGANHGILMKGAAFAPGLVGQAFSFDGQGSYT